MVATSPGVGVVWASSPTPVGAREARVKHPTWLRLPTRPVGEVTATDPRISGYGLRPFQDGASYNIWVPDVRLPAFSVATGSPRTGVPWCRCTGLAAAQSLRCAPTSVASEDAVTSGDYAPTFSRISPAAGACQVAFGVTSMPVSRMRAASSFTWLASLSVSNRLKPEAYSSRAKPISYFSSVVSMDMVSPPVDAPSNLPKQRARKLKLVRLARRAVLESLPRGAEISLKW